MYISRYAENHASINVCIPTLNSVLDLSSGHPALLPFQTFNNGKIQHQENEDEKDRKYSPKKNDKVKSRECSTSLSQNGKKRKNM